MARGLFFSLLAIVFLCGLTAALCGLWRARDGSVNAPLFWSALGLFFTALLLNDISAHHALVKDAARTLLAVGVLGLAASLLARDRLIRRLPRLRYRRQIETAPMAIKLER